MCFGVTAEKAAKEIIKSDAVQKGAATAMGMLFPYVGLRKRALETYLKEIEQSDLSTDAKVIATLGAKEHMKKLKNRKRIADIAMVNAEEGTTFEESGGVGEEWLERFMDSAGFVSDEEVQLIWGNVLAGEFENPGSTPTNMIRILSEMSSQYAKAFQLVCSMCRHLIILDESGNPLDFSKAVVVPYSGNNDALNELGLSFRMLSELETLGLIKFDSFAGYVTTGLPDGCTVLSYIQGVTKEVADFKGETIPTGNVLLTDAGKCLSRIVEGVDVEGYEELESAYMAHKSVNYKKETNFEIVDNGKGELVLNRR